MGRFRMWQVLAAVAGLAALTAGCSSSDDSDTGSPAATGGAGGSTVDAGGTGGTDAGGKAGTDASAAGGSEAGATGGNATGGSDAAAGNADTGAPDTGNPEAGTPDADASNPDADAAAVWAPFGGGDAGGEVAPGAAALGRIASANGVTYAAFSDATNDGKLTVMKSSGTGWAVVGTAGFTTDVVNTTSLAIVVDGTTPYVAYKEPDGNGMYGVVVQKFNGTSWVPVGARFGTIRNLDGITLVVSGSTLYAAFQDDTNTAHVMSYSGSAWADLGTMPPSQGSFAFGLNGTTPYLAVTDDVNLKTPVYSYAGGTWTLVTTIDGVIGDYQWDPKFVSSNGSLYLICSNSIAGGAAVFKLVGSTFESVGDLGSIAPNPNHEYVSGVVYNGVPYVAFDDETQDPDGPAATVMRWTGTTWERYAGYGSLCDIEDTMLAVGTDGSLYLTFSDCNGSMTVEVAPAQ